MVLFVIVGILAAGGFDRGTGQECFLPGQTDSAILLLQLNRNLWWIRRVVQPFLTIFLTQALDCLARPKGASKDS